MIVRKNISIDQCYIEKLKPFLEKNNGNLSAAIRDAIETASQAMAKKVNDYRENGSKNNLQYAEFRNNLVEEEEFLLIHHTLLEWLIRKSNGLLIDESIVYELISPYKTKQVQDVVNYLNTLNEKMGWKVKVDAEYDVNLEPETLTLTLLNGNLYLRTVMAQSLAFYLAKQMKLDIQGLFNKSNVTKIYFKKCEYLDYEKVPKGLEENFGYMENTSREIQKRPEFWKNLVNVYKCQNYQCLSINRKIFEAFVSGNLPSVADRARDFELLIGQPPSAFTLAENLIIFKELCLMEGIGNDIEICTEKGNEYIKLIHDYSDQKVCEYITAYYSNTLKSIGHPFKVVNNPHLILFEFKNQPELIYSSTQFASVPLE